MVAIGRGGNRLSPELIAKEEEGKKRKKRKKTKKNKKRKKRKKKKKKKRKKKRKKRKKSEDHRRSSRVASRLIVSCSPYRLLILLIL